MIKRVAWSTQGRLFVCSINRRYSLCTEWLLIIKVFIYPLKCCVMMVARAFRVRLAHNQLWSFAEIIRNQHELVPNDFKHVQPVHYLLERPWAPSAITQGFHSPRLFRLTIPTAHIGNYYLFCYQMCRQTKTHWPSLRKTLIPAHETIFCPIRFG